MDRKGRKTHTSICLGDKEKNHPFFSGQICNLDILRLFILERQGGQAIANFNTCKSRSTGLWCLCAFGFFSLVVSFGLQKVEKRRSLKILEIYPGANSRKMGKSSPFSQRTIRPPYFRPQPQLSVSLLLWRAWVSPQREVGQGWRQVVPTDGVQHQRYPKLYEGPWWELERRGF